MNPDLLQQRVPGTAYRERVKPLVVDINSGLYLESGNDDMRFNRNYATGNALPQSMIGLRPILNEGSVEELYELQLRISDTNRRVTELASFLGLKIPEIRPIYAVTDGNGMLCLNETKRLYTPYQQLRILNSLFPLANNQLPVYMAENLHLLKQAYPRLSIDPDLTTQSAELTRRLNRKDVYYESVQNHIAVIPRHVETRLARINDLPDSWEEFCTQYNVDWRKVVIKSAVDAGSEVNVILTEESYLESLLELRQQNAEKLQNPNREEENIPVLIQRFVETPKSEDVVKSFGVGLSISPSGEVGIIALTSQLYSDQYYVGSHLDVSEEAEILDQIGRDRLVNLGRIFADQGYAGSVFFDGMNEIIDDEIIPLLIYDGNFRISAAAFTLSVASWLMRSGFEVSSITNVGYLGKYKHADISKLLTSLNNDGILFDKRTGKGIIPLPNATSPEGYDLVFVNCSRSEVISGWNKALQYGSSDISNLHF